MQHRRPYQLSASPAAVPPPLHAGIDPAVVAARRAAMVAAGTHPVLAERLALSASENQAMRDRHPRFAARPVEPAVVG